MIDLNHLPRKNDNIKILISLSQESLEKLDTFKLANRLQNRSVLIEALITEFFRELEYSEKTVKVDY